MEFSPCLMDNSNYKWPFKNFPSFSIAFCKRLPEANSTDWVQNHPKSWGSASRYIFPKGVPTGPRARVDVYLATGENPPRNWIDSQKKRWDQEVPFFLRKARLLELDKKSCLKIGRVWQCFAWGWACGLRMSLQNSKNEEFPISLTLW